MTFRNPLKLAGADPWLMCHEGWFYLSTTSGVDVRLRRARRLGDLKDAPDVVVWKDGQPGRSRDLWAPEFHRLDGGRGLRWYLYFTASDGAEPNHRMFVAESQGDDPRGPYAFRAKLRTDADDAQYAIDGTVIRASGGRLYFAWCGRPSPAGQGLYIARMANPWTLTGERRYLEAEGFGCPVVREGPVALERGGRVFLVYSACSADTPDYRLGMLVADASADLADPAAWRQHPRPVLARADERGVFGPGHCSFFRSPDGKEDWIAYHAKPGTAVSYVDRSTRAQRFGWSEDGTPRLGAPLPLDTDIPEPSGVR